LFHTIALQINLTLTSFGIRGDSNFASQASKMAFNPYGVQTIPAPGRQFIAKLGRAGSGANRWAKPDSLQLLLFFREKTFFRIWVVAVQIGLWQGLLQQNEQTFVYPGFP